MAMAKALQPLAETKLKGLASDYPNLSTTGNSTGFTILSMGRNIPPTSLTMASSAPLAMFNFKQGVGKNKRDGRSLFIKGCTVRSRVEYQPHYTTWNNGQNVKLYVPQFCRYLVVRPKNNNTYLANPNLDADLFYDQNGDKRGLTSTAITDFQLTNLRVNTKQYAVMLDKRFTLSPSSLTSMDSSNTNPQDKNTTRQFNGKYPVFKDVNFKIPIGRKVRFISDASDSPQDLNDDYFVILLNVPVGGSIQSGSAETMIDGLIGLNMIASTTALDL